MAICTIIAIDSINGGWMIGQMVEEFISYFQKKLLILIVYEFENIPKSDNN